MISFTWKHMVEVQFFLSSEKINII